MKVHLIATPDVHPELMDEILEILNSVVGPISFSFIREQWTPFDLEYTQEARHRGNQRFKIDSEFKLQEYNALMGPPLSWKELFYLCEKARERNKITEEEVVVVVTNRRNSMNFFSMFDVSNKRNAFIQSSDWEHFIDTSQKFPIAYEVIANVLRIFSAKDVHRHEEMNRYFHEESIGCINDFCENKKQIILKLRTADICRDCMSLLEEKGTHQDVLLQCIKILEEIRLSLKFSQGLAANLKPKKLRISNEGVIFLDEKKLKLNPIQSTIFIFFVKHLEGIRLVELDDYQHELFEIYKRLKSNPDPKKIESLICAIDGSFSYNKSRLSRAIKEQVGEPMASYYCINGVPGEPFKLLLERQYIVDEF